MTANLWLTAISLESADIILIFVQITSLEILLGAVALICICLAAIFSILTFKKRMKRRALMTDEILPEIGSRFGTNVAVEEFGKSIANPSVALHFARHGTPFNARILRTAGNEFEDAQTEYKVEFRLTKLREQFSICRKSGSSNFSFGGRAVSIPEMPDDFIFYSRNPQFLAALVSDKKIRMEIFSYRRDVSPPFEISFENGVFLISQIRNTEDGLEEEAARIEQVCRTAVVFHDKLAAF